MELLSPAYLDQSSVSGSVMELPVLVLAEQSLSDVGKGISLAHAQSFLEGIVQFDLSSSTDDVDTACSIVPVSAALCL